MAIARIRVRNKSSIPAEQLSVGPPINHTFKANEIKTLFGVDLDLLAASPEIQALVNSNRIELSVLEDPTIPDVLEFASKDIVKFDTEATLLLSIPDDGAVAYARDTDQHFFRQAGVWTTINLILENNDITFKGVVTFRPQDVADVVKFQDASIANLEPAPVTVRFLTRVFPAPLGAFAEATAIYARLDPVGAPPQQRYAIYGDISTNQADATHGAFLKIIHAGHGDAMVVNMFGFGAVAFEAACHIDGTKGIISTLQVSAPNSTLFNALWDFPVMPNFGMYYADQSYGHALTIRKRIGALDGNAQIRIVENDFTRNRFAVFNAGHTHWSSLAADAGNPLRESPELHLRGAYWTGALSQDRDVILKHVVTSTSSSELRAFMGDVGGEVQVFSIEKDGAQRVAIGTGAVSSGNFGVAVGAFASASGQTSAAFGASTSALGLNSTALGHNAQANAASATAVGKSAQSTAANTTTIGQDALGTAADAVAAGFDARAEFANAVSIGSGTRSTGQHSVSVGKSVIAGERSVAVGGFSNANTTDGTAVGELATSGLRGIAIGSQTGVLTDGVGVGYNADVLAADGVAVGSGANLTALATGGSVAIGKSVTLNAANNVAVGTLTGAVTGANVTAVGIGVNIGVGVNDCTAIGAGAIASGTECTVVGKSAGAATSGGTAVGRGASAGGNFAVVVGHGSSTGADCVSIGAGISNIFARSTVVGRSASATSFDAVAIGYSADATAASSTAMGADAQATNANTVAVGQGAIAAASGSIAIGSGTNVANGATTCIAIGRLVSISGALSDVVVIGGSAGGSQGTSVGRGANSGASAGCTAIGESSFCGGTDATAIGKSANANNINAVAIGRSAVTSGNGSIAIGRGVTIQNNPNDIAIGNGLDLNSLSATNAVVVGTLTGAVTAAGVTSLGIGNNIGVGVANVTVIGATAQATTTDSTAVGFDAQATTGTASTAIGQRSRATATSATALGDNAFALFNESTALGKSSNCSGSESVAVGKSAAAAGTGTAVGWTALALAGSTAAFGRDAQAGSAVSTAIGAGSRATAALTVSVGGIASAANATALGASADAIAISATVVGANAQGGGVRGIAIGDGAEVGVGHTNAIAIGSGAITDGANDGQWGSATFPTRFKIHASIALPIVTKIADYTADGLDYTILVDATAGAVTITLPTAIGVTVKGRIYNIKKIDATANAVIIDGNGAETIDGVATQTTTTQWANFQIQSNGTAWFILG